MTRINVVPVAELCDQHLLAEHRELTRIPNRIAREVPDLTNIPRHYLLGTGHVRFFFTRLTWLKRRHERLHAECLRRGFNVQNRWPDDLPDDSRLWNDYRVTAADLALNRARIQERWPARARFTSPSTNRKESTVTATKTFTLNDHSFTFRASAVPMMRTDRLLAYLSNVGYDDVWLTKHLQPLLQRWEKPSKILTLLKEKQFDAADVSTLSRLLKKLFRHQVRDWYEQVTATDEEGTPERELADEQDYWAAYVPKFANKLYRLRTIKHGGQLLFMADDVAAMYGGGYERHPVALFMQKAVKCIKNYTLKKITYREILSAAPSAEGEKASLKQGKWFMDRRTMLRVIARSSRPSAQAFVDHLINVLDGKAETLAAFKEKKIKARSEARSHQLKGYRGWEGNVRDHGASVVRTNGEVFQHVTDGQYATQADYCAAHGIDKPFNDNLPEPLVRKTNGIREISMMIADKRETRGQHPYNAVVAEAANLVSAIMTNPDEAAAFAASQGFTRGPWEKRRQRT